MNLEDRIDRAAWALFLRRGYRQVTMDDLAGELGISKKTLYRVIDGKQALLTRLVRHRLAAAEAETAAIATNPNSTAYEKLRGLLQYALTQLGGGPPTLLHDVRLHAPHLWDEIEATRDRVIAERLAEVLRIGVARGELREDLEPEVANVVLFHALRGVIGGALSADPLRFARFLETAIQLLYEGIRRRPA